MHYRPEIDGLRAIAVIPVIFFHAGFERVSGGFVGVDVFFVISGYLITSIIINAMDNEKFSLTEFYERRARRILPALFFIMAVCIPFAWMWLMPRDVNDFAQSIIAVATFSSNFLFWQESGYFASEAELKPLLHTWSLAVEEQYYVLFPVFMMLVWRLGKRRILWLFIVLFILSLGMATWGVANRPSAAFYLLPTRGWELLLGAFCAVYLNRFGNLSIRRDLSDVLGLAGLGLIFYSIIAFDKNTPFPGLWALVPTVGTALVIFCAQDRTIGQRILSNKALVGVGLISYSAYLWHQPLLAFAKHRSVTHPSDLALFALCIATFPLAMLSWRFVEIPFRNRSFLGRNTIFALAILISAFFIIFGAVRYDADGFEERWLSRQSADVQKTYRLINIDKEKANFGVDSEGRQDNGDCRFNANSLDDRTTERLAACAQKYGNGVVILGDSHAVDLFGVITSRRDDNFIVGITRPACRPRSPLPQCQYDDFLGFLEQNPQAFSHVIYEQAAVFMLRTERGQATRETFNSLPPGAPVTGISIDEESADAALEYLKKIAQFVPVLWFGPRIEPHFTDKMIMRLGCEHRFEMRPNHQIIFDELDSYISRITFSEPRISFLSQNDAFNIEFPEDFMSCEEIYWSDGDHFSADGEKRFGARFDLVQYLRESV